MTYQNVRKNSMRTFWPASRPSVQRFRSTTDHWLSKMFARPVCGFYIMLCIGLKGLHCDWRTKMFVDPFCGLLGMWFDHRFKKSVLSLTAQNVRRILTYNLNYFANETASVFLKYEVIEHAKQKNITWTSMDWL